MDAEKISLVNHLDFSDSTQSIGLMVKEFSNNHFIDFHRHDSHQLLYATDGVMRLKTANESWIVPNKKAVLIPCCIDHSLHMFGDVVMHTLYINPDMFELNSDNLHVIHITNLMRELIIALSAEPTYFDTYSKGHKITQLLEVELSESKIEYFSVPLPTDARLQKLCASLLADPSDRKTIEEWGIKCGASTRTLNRLCDRELGMSFRHWRQLVRFHNAIEDLSSGYSVAQVAYKNGYHSPSAFSHAFRNIIGKSPSEILK